MTIYYAGLGSPETPVHVQYLMSEMAEELARRGYGLRGGWDTGGELAFAEGALAAEGVMDMVLPWPGFNERPGEAVAQQVAYSRAVEIASHHHPAWTSLKAPIRKHMVAMVMKVLGRDLATPVRWVQLWGADPRFDRQGLVKNIAGNIGVAARLAYEHGIPVFHLDSPKHIDRINRMCGTNFIVGGGLDARKTA